MLKAAAIQKVTREPLLKILTDMGIISDIQAAQILATQWEYEYVDLLNYPVDKESLRLVDPEKMKNYFFFLMKRENGVYHIAISDPTNIETIDYIRLSFGSNIKIYIATKGAIQQAIEKYYELETALKRAEEEVETGTTGPKLLKSTKKWTFQGSGRWEKMPQ